MYNLLLAFTTFIRPVQFSSFRSIRCATAPYGAPRNVQSRSLLFEDKSFGRLLGPHSNCAIVRLDAHTPIGKVKILEWLRPVAVARYQLLVYPDAGRKNMGLFSLIVNDTLEQFCR